MTVWQSSNFELISVMNVRSWDIDLKRTIPNDTGLGSTRSTAGSVLLEGVLYTCTRQCYYTLDENAVVGLTFLSKLCRADVSGRNGG